MHQDVDLTEKASQLFFKSGGLTSGSRRSISIWDRSTWVYLPLVDKIRQSIESVDFDDCGQIPNTAINGSYISGQMLSLMGKMVVPSKMVP